MATRILVSGFEPFGGEAVNPSQEAVEALDRMTLPGIALRTVVLPTRFGGALARLDAELARWPAEVVLSVGLAGGRAGLTVERVAINLADARIPDNDGAQPVDQPVVAGAPAAYFARLPVKAMTAAIRAAGVEAGVSHSAGTFVCNHVFFGLCHRAATTLPGLRCGFMHVPWLPEQAARHGGGPAMDTETATRGLAAALLAVAAGAADPAVAEGALC